MYSNSVFRITNDTLKGVLSLYASAWASEAVHYRELQPNAENLERAFWFGMSNAFEDSADQLIKRLDKPTVSNVFIFIQVLAERQAQADYYHAGLTDQPSLSAYTLGIAEAYKTCADYLADILIP